MKRSKPVTPGTPDFQHAKACLEEIIHRLPVREGRAWWQLFQGPLAEAVRRAAAGEFSSIVPELAGDRFLVSLRIYDPFESDRFNDFCFEVWHQTGNQTKQARQERNQATASVHGRNHTITLSSLPAIHPINGKPFVRVEMLDCSEQVKAALMSWLRWLTLKIELPPQTKPPVRPDALLSPQDIATRLSVSLDVVYGWIKTGTKGNRLVAINTAKGTKNSRYKVAPNELERFLKKVGLGVEAAPAVTPTAAQKKVIPKPKREYF